MDKFENMIIACNYEQKQKGKLSTKRDTDRLSLGKRTRSKHDPEKIMELMTGEEKEVAGFKKQEAVHRTLREFLKAMKAEGRLYKDKYKEGGARESNSHSSSFASCDQMCTCLQTIDSQGMLPLHDGSQTSSVSISL